MWGAGVPFNAKAWEPLLRMWGLSPDSPRWQEMMRDLERGQAPWGTVNQVCSSLPCAALHCAAEGVLPLCSGQLKVPTSL